MRFRTVVFASNIEFDCIFMYIYSPIGMVVFNPSMYVEKQANPPTGCIVHSLLVHCSFSPHQQGRIDFNTCQSFPVHREGISDPLPCRKIDDERMSVLHQNSGCIEKSIPSALKISLEISFRLRPREISRASGMDFPIPPSFWWSTDTIHSDWR